MIARVLLAALCCAWLAACTETPAGGPAGQCAEVVRIYRDLQGAVVVVGQPVETSEGRVEIEYEGTGAMNLPVKGQASCTFTVAQGGVLTLVEAVVEGTLIEGPEADALRKQLGKQR